MAWWQWLVGILLFILALGILVGIHELGHLSAAKLFHVYCVDYSIGFGPKLFQTKKSKKRETTWTLRAIPLGGFVAMYGEGMELEGNEYIPPSRSLEGVARYKRAIIISAGVILNFILGFVLILLHNGCFDHVSINLYSRKDDQYSTMLVVSTKKGLEGVSDNDALKLNIDILNSVYVIDPEVSIEGIDEKYVLATDGLISTTKYDPPINYIIYGTNKGKLISEQIEDQIKSGYKRDTLKSIIVINEKIDISDKGQLESLNNRLDDLYNRKANDQEFREQFNLYYNKCGIKYSINKDVKYTPAEGAKDVNVTMNFYKYNQVKEESYKEQYSKNFTFKLNESKNGWQDLGIYLKRTIERYNAAKTFQVTWNEWCQANSTIFVALGNIFTGNLSSIGGPVAIARISSTVLSNFGFERYLYLWGQISCNLAIINLLPFPGLDGWSLLVIAYEGIRKKQIPMKAKAIISIIGLMLLFGLMFVILIKDIVGIFA